MFRKAILIGSPRAKDSGDYSKGINPDLHQFRKFLKSPAGGSWEDSEIAEFNNCLLENLLDIFRATECEYMLVYFTGRGSYQLKDTILSVNDKEETSVLQLISLVRAPRALIIIDVSPKIIESSLSTIIGKQSPSFDDSHKQSNSAEHYKQLIAACDAGITIAYNSAIGEVANDTELGGVYTGYLLSVDKEWYDKSDVGSNLSINEASDLAGMYMRSDLKYEQTPQVRSTNTGNLKFPFAIKTA